MTQSIRPEDYLAVFEAAAIEAGRAILAVRDAGFAVTAKDDRSPVTEADEAADRIIVAALRDAFPHIGVVAEESGATGASRAGEPFFLVDPLDGTKEFVAGRDEFTVNIALIEDGRSVCGVVFAPACGELFAGSHLGAYRRAISSEGPGAPAAITVRPAPDRVIALASRSHRTAETDAYLATLSLEGVHAVGSSMKFCRIAEGVADVYPCFGRTMEWDTAAGQAVLEAAGGRVLTLDGTPLAYGKPAGSDVAGANPSFIARGG